MDKNYFGLQSDGHYYAAPNEQRFIAAYENNWTEIMADTYFSSEKVDVGHKLRPRLVYWGFLLCNGNPDDDMFEHLGKLAVSIELIHKASLLIDDYIDKDTARHGRPAFYVEYGVERTIIYSLNLLSISLRLMNSVFAARKGHVPYFNSMASIINMLESMTIGVLKELDLGQLSSHSLKSIQEIMILETAELITSSMISGYSLAGGADETTICALKNICQKVGFVFQVLNDLEPFTMMSHDHKGSLNIDVSRRRKNYCVALINELASKKEKGSLDLLNNKELEIIVQRLMEKYHIVDLLLAECRSTFDNAISELPQAQGGFSWCEQFTHFLESVYQVSYGRLKKC